MKKEIQFKGQLRLYMQWPAIMMILLVAMNIWIYQIDKKAGFVMTAFVLIYGVIVGILYFYNKSLLLSELVEFAGQYGAVQNVLLKELSIPYVILLEDGNVIWGNEQFSEMMEGRKEKYGFDMVDELDSGTEQRTVPVKRGCEDKDGDILRG